MKDFLKGIGTIFLISMFFIAFIQKGTPSEKNNMHLAILFFIVILLLILSILFFRKRSNPPTGKTKEELLEQTRQLIANNQINPIAPKSMLPKKNESVYLEQEAVLKVVKNKILGSSGSSGGASVRVAKGIYLHSRSSGSKKIYGDVTTKYCGTLAISNQRIVFTNPEKGFEIPLSKLSSIESDLNTIVFQQGSKVFYLESNHCDIIEYFVRHMAAQN